MHIVNKWLRKISLFIYHHRHKRIYEYLHLQQFTIKIHKSNNRWTLMIKKCLNVKLLLLICINQIVKKNDLVSFVYYNLQFSTKIRHDMHSRINIHECTHARTHRLRCTLSKHAARLPCLRSARWLKPMMHVPWLCVEYKFPRGHDLE